MAKIIAVRVASGNENESGITDVKLYGGIEKQVSTVVNDIDTGKEGYYYTLSSERADVITAKNPNSYGKHIRTSPDSSKSNNLLKLDRF